MMNLGRGLLASSEVEKESQRKDQVQKVFGLRDFYLFEAALRFQAPDVPVVLATVIAPCPRVAMRKCASFVSRDTLDIVSALRPRLKQGGREASEAQDEMHAKISRLRDEQDKALEAAPEANVNVEEEDVPAQRVDAGEDAERGGAESCEVCEMWLNGTSASCVRPWGWGV